MKNILKKYYELDDESKEILPFLYMYEAYLSIKEDYENIKIENLTDEELLMKIIIKCWYSTSLDPSDIVERIFKILDCKDITLKDLENLTIDELEKLIIDEKNKKDSQILAEFIYRGFYCVFCKNTERYFLIITKGEESDVIQFDKLEDVLIPIITKHIHNKFLHGKTDNYD